MILYNDDAYKKIKELKDNSIDLVLIDPPYDIEGIEKERKIKKCSSYIDYCAKKTMSKISAFSKGIDFSILDEFSRICKKLNLFIFCNKQLLFKLINYYIDDNYLKEVLIWHKTNVCPLTSGTFLPDIEYIFYVRERGVKLRGGYYEKKKVFETQTNIREKNIWQHPTIKPQEILMNLIKVSTDEKDIVLDCFMGTGSTGVASHKTNREFIGIEIDKKWFDIAQKRIKQEQEKISIWEYLDGKENSKN